MKSFSLIKVMNVALLLFTLSLCAYLFIKDDGYVYVDTYKVYEGFSMKKKLQKELEESYNKNTSPIDSLKLEIKMLSLSYNQSKQKNEEIKKVLIEKSNRAKLIEQEANMQREELVEKYNQEIWSQINQLIEDYGKENGFKMIIGASGNGTLMYGDASKNKTEDVLKYINQKYKGL